MKQNHTILKAVRKATVVIFFAATAFGAFAMLGDGRTKRAKSSLFPSYKDMNYKPGSFSLKSGYNYRGNQVINLQEDARKYINLNTVVTYEKGNTTYIVPLKKKIYVNISNSRITLNH